MNELTVLTIDPMTRIEGHLKVEMQVDDSTEPFPTVSRAQCSGTLFRGIEVILKDRDPRDAFHITQRICGVCPASHGTASIMALEEAFNVRPPDNAILIRNIIQGANFLMSHILHFYVLQGLEWGVLADIPEMLPPVKAGLGTHYAKAIEMRRKAHELVSIFGGKMPHFVSYVPGGVTVLLTPDKVASAQIKMVELKNFVTDVMIPDSERIVRNLKDLRLYNLVKMMGKGTGNFLSYGVFPTPETYEDRKNWLLKPTSGFDEREIREYVVHSWYDETWDDKHPSERETKDYYEKPGAYSWITAPRYRGEVYETGPLARMVNSKLYDLIEPKGSALDRTLARCREAGIIASAMMEWISGLRPGERVFSRWNGYPDVPPSGEGMGLWEAPRGSLGHWLKVEAKKIQGYQVLTPTNWNASPRDDQGRPGPMENALAGTFVPKVDTSGFLVELGHPLAERVKGLGLSDLNYWERYNVTLPLMVIRSFDPCMACSVHLITANKRGPVKKLTREAFHLDGQHCSSENLERQGMTQNKAHYLERVHAVKTRLVGKMFLALTRKVSSLSGASFTVRQSSLKPSINPGYFRPPGAMDERDFVNVCLRCQRCVEVCSTKSIRPLSLMKGFWVAWTPAITVNSGGYCIRCLSCVKTCASGALQKIERDQIKIGIAVIDEKKCLAWTVGGCSKCVNTCPLVNEGQIAIKIIEGKPVVQEDTCIGCAVCTIRCPVDAITISPYEKEIEGRGTHEK